LGGFLFLRCCGALGVGLFQWCYKHVISSLGVCTSAWDLKCYKRVTESKARQREALQCAQMCYILSSWKSLQPEYKCTCGSPLKYKRLRIYSWRTSAVTPC
jgi:hypothetical protein